MGSYPNLEPQGQASDDEGAHLETAMKPPSPKKMAPVVNCGCYRLGRMDSSVQLN